MLVFTKPNMPLGSNSEISLLITRSTSAEKLDYQHAWKIFGGLYLEL